MAFLLTRSKAPLVLICGAAVAGWLAVLLATSVVRTTRVKEDSALGLAMASFFGFGLVLLTFIQKLPDARQAGLKTFLFGQASVLMLEDVITTAVLGGASLLVLALFWKEFKLLTFDREFAATLGMRVRAFDMLLTTLLVGHLGHGGLMLLSSLLMGASGVTAVWMPHSVLSQPFQRPERGSSPGATLLVHGEQPIDG